MHYEVESGRTRLQLHFENEEQKYTKAFCDNNSYALGIKKIQDDHFLLRLNGQNFDILILQQGDNRKININGKLAEISVLDSRMRKLQEISRAEKKLKNTEEVKAPMPGLVLHVHVKEGEKVKANDGLLVIEAMKMENEIRATANGVVKKIQVKEGQAVDKGSLLLRME